MSRLDYIKELRESKTKAITITIEEDLIDEIEEIAEEIGVSRNQIISHVLRKFTEDFEKVRYPNYFILKADSINIDEAVNPYLNMLRGNKACAWGADRHIINELEVGDYVFILDNELGIVGAGTVVSEPNYNSHSYIDITELSEDGESNLVKPYDEIYVNIDYDIKFDFEIDSLEENIWSFNIFQEEVMKMFKEDTVGAKLVTRMLKEMEEFLYDDKKMILRVRTSLGNRLKDMYIEKYKE